MSTFKEGDRVVILGNEQHGVVTKMRLDILGQPLVYVQLDDETFTDVLYGGIWTARPFELREEGQDE